MHTTAVLVFAVVYLGMLLGELPKLQLDRTGVALLGALVLMITGVVTLEEASDAVHLPTLALLFGMMVLSAQLRLGGFYTAITDRLERAPLSPPALLAALIGLVGLLSAVFTNDIVCLATAPVIIAGCRERGLAPIPFLLGLACAANVGSAATLIGPLLALASTLAGNLLIVGSIASIIVVEQAAGEGIVIDWRTHARVGVPVTLLTLVIAGGTLWIAGG